MVRRTLARGDSYIFEEGLIDGLAALNLRGTIGTNDGRVRVAQGITRNSTKMIADNLPLIYDDQQISGSGTASTFNNSRSSVMLSVSDSTAGARVRQTFAYHDYEPNKTSLFSSTFILGSPVAGVTKRIGLFDSNNGLFLEQTGDGVFFVVRSNTSGSPADNRIAIANSNIDRDAALDIDFTKIQNMVILFNWYGAGLVTFAFQRDGALIRLHSFRHDNVSDVVYMQTPQLPIRYEIRNDGTGGAATVEQVANAYVIEGIGDDDGIPFAASRGTSAITAGTLGDWYPLISTRVQSNYLGRRCVPAGVSVVPDGDGIYEVGVFRNPSIAGTDAASWQQYTGAAIEYDISRDTSNLITGTPLQIETDSTTQRGGGELDLTLSRLVTYGAAIDGTPEELVIAVRLVTGTSADFYGAFNWIEFI